MNSLLQLLRAANVARNDEWQNTAKPFTLVFWANELAGEVGEACNILKKLDREHNYGVRGSRAALPALGEELADVIICSDLLGMAAKIEYGAACWPYYPQQDKHDYSLYGAHLAASAGRACGIAIHYMTHLNSSQLASVMAGLVKETKQTADRLGLNLDQLVATKFNMTSDKLGLKTKLVF